MSTQFTDAQIAGMKMSMARESLLRDDPFFGILAYSLTIKPAPENLPMLGPVATDQLSIIYDPVWVFGQSIDMLKFVVAHEVLHCALLHCTRMREIAGDRPDQNIMAVYNIACDIVVNGMLAQSGYNVPKDFVQPVPEWAHLTAEQIFVKLLKEGQGKGQGQGQGSGTVGDVLPYGAGGNPDGSPADVSDRAIQDAATRQEQTTASAELTAQRQGKVPAFVKRALDNQRRVKTDWRTPLLKFMRRLTPGKRSWGRPSRRMAWTGIHLPSRIKTRTMGEVVIGIDTSGSVTGAILDLFAGEFRAIVAQVKPVATHAVWCDAKVHCVQTFKATDQLVLTPQGGGGTDFRPVFDWVEKEGVAPACLIYITDMYGAFPDKAPDYPVLWVSCSGEHGPKAPFGETIFIQE